MPDSAINKFLDTTGLTHLIASLKNLFVEQQEGYGLSQEDFTPEDAAKLDSLFNYVLPKASATILGGIKIGANMSIAEDGTLSFDGLTSVGWSDITGKPDVALKSDITNIYRYKGSVATYSELPTTNRVEGDVWDVRSDGMNYAWNGTTWDALGATFTINAITNAEIDSILGGS